MRVLTCDMGVSAVTSSPEGIILPMIGRGFDVGRDSPTVIGQIYMWGHIKEEVMIVKKYIYILTT